MSSITETPTPGRSFEQQALIDESRDLSLPIRSRQDLDPLIDAIGDARCVLLGEASHGTSDYYMWRYRISERLIEEKGFSFIAVEGDWPDCCRVNRYVKHLPGSGSSGTEVLHAFDRWPTWMWANREVVHLVELLRRHNVRQTERAVGFYGLDVYSLWQSMAAVLSYLDRVDPQTAEAVRRNYACFEPYSGESEDYAWATVFVPTSCEDEVVSALLEMQGRRPQFDHDGDEAAFDAEQNALIVRDAESYYRTMVRGGGESWNVRDWHMVATLNRLLDWHGPDSKAIVWEHNTHVGDARATDMADDGMVNVGQLTRERWGVDDTYIVGFGSYHGSVIAGSAWGAPMEVMPLPQAQPGSWEDVLHGAGGVNRLLLLRGSDTSGAFRRRRGHRAVGVVYNPHHERCGNYVPTVLPDRYDAFVYLDSTHALRPLHMVPVPNPDMPETYPWQV